MDKNTFTRLPTTVLSGFLGAGKTTLLNRVLSADHGLKIAVIVNDMSEVNIDSELVKQGGLTRTDARVVEMHNGCICCTLRDDLLVEIGKLARSGKFDYLLIESTGISEPMPVAETFTFPLADGPELNSVARLDTLVTVVDGFNFLRQYQEADDLPDDKDGKTVADLLIEQIEFANVLVISKVDMIAEPALLQLKAVLQNLNPKARLVTCSNGDLPLKEILDTGLFSMEAAQKAAGWLTVLRGEEKPETEEFGISSFVWQARKPLHPERFWNFFNGNWRYGRLLRSKGFFWLATQFDRIGVWQQAGGMMGYRDGGSWWASVPRQEWPQSEEAVAWIESRWQDGIGDRRQEIVFIGQNLDRQALLADLDACLLTEREMQAGSTEWRRYRDYFLG